MLIDNEDRLALVTEHAGNLVLSLPVCECEHVMALFVAAPLNNYFHGSCLRMFVITYFNFKAKT